MISINATLLVQLINFLLLMYILNRLLFRPILQTVRERRERIEQARKDAKDMTKQGEDLLVENGLKIEAAKTEANQRKEIMKAEAQVEADRIIADSMVGEEKIVTRIRDEIAQEAHAVRQTFRKQAQGLSIYVTKKVIGRELK
ncbi:MAG: ATP synthase F0 subunit B [Deltaproteobacteria bacterium]|nr:ATP synthase F0 subunit B [Deltaproteobacteria bacterium]